MKLSKEKIAKFIDSSSLSLNILSYIHLMARKIGTSFPVYAPPFLCKIKAGRNVKIGRNCFLMGKIELENNVVIGSYSVLDGVIHISQGTNLVKNDELIGEIKIGRYCAIARNVVFQGRNHFMHKPGIQSRFYKEMIGEKLGTVSKGPIMMGNDVWIGTRAIILSGVKIGDGAIVGAGAVVTKDVEPYEIVAGVPARHIKWRFPEHIRKQLMEIKWWNWSEEKIRRNKKFFTTDLNKVDDVYELIVE